MIRPTTRPSIVLAAALHAAGRGWPVFPLRPAGKFPLIRAAHPAGHPCRGQCGRDGHGFHDASTDPDRIRAWWRACPRANYGISTGPAGLVVVDLDTGKGTPPPLVLPDQGDGEATPRGIWDGADVLDWAAERAGAEPGWQDTLTVATPSGGTHLYYAAPAGVVVRSSVGHNGSRITGLGWSVDVRAVGGYVAGPGSTATPNTRNGDSNGKGNGKTDGYAAIIKGAAAPLPGWLLGLLTRIGSVGNGQPCMAGEVPGQPDPLPGNGIGGRTDVRSGYGPAAVAGELANVAASVAGGQGGSGRNATLNRAAFKLGRLIDACHLDPEHVTAQLQAAGEAVGLSPREAAAAIASGLAGGRTQPRTRAPAAPPQHRSAATTSGGRP